MANLLMIIVLKCMRDCVGWSHRYAGVQEDWLQYSADSATSFRIEFPGSVPTSRSIDQRSEQRSKEITLSKIARRKFIQLSAVAAAGCLVSPRREARAQDMPHLPEDDPMAMAMKYTHDASTVDPSARANPAAEQTCENCALVQGNDGDEWRPCQIFPGKLVNAAGWCSVWAPKA